MVNNTVLDEVHDDIQTATFTIYDAVVDFAMSDLLSGTDDNLDDEELDYIESCVRDNGELFSLIDSLIYRAVDEAAHKAINEVNWTHEIMMAERDE